MSCVGYELTTQQSRWQIRGGASDVTVVAAQCYLYADNWIDRSMSGGCASCQGLPLRQRMFGLDASLEYASRFRLNVFEAEQVESN
jgi:hypothetical protein